MSSNNPVVTLEPFAVRPREGARLAGVGLTKFYERLNEAAYESFLDGSSRLVTVESIKAFQRKQLAASRGAPVSKPSVRGRPRKTA